MHNTEQILQSICIAKAFWFYVELWVFFLIKYTVQFNLKHN